MYPFDTPPHPLSLIHKSTSARQLRACSADAGNRADGGWAGLKVPCIPGCDVAGVRPICDDGPNRIRFEPEGGRRQ